MTSNLSPSYTMVNEGWVPTVYTGSVHGNKNIGFGYNLTAADPSDAFCTLKSQTYRQMVEGFAAEYHLPLPADIGPVDPMTLSPVEGVYLLLRALKNQCGIFFQSPHFVSMDWIGGGWGYRRIPCYANEAGKVIPLSAEVTDLKSTFLVTHNDPVGNIRDTLTLFFSFIDSIVWASPQLAALLDMIYNLGGEGAASFDTFLGYYLAGDMEAASNDLVNNTAYYRELPMRVGMTAKLLTASPEAASQLLSPWTDPFFSAHPEFDVIITHLCNYSK